MTLDPRYWRERDPGLLDHVARQWRRAYPGTSRHSGFRRPDPRPALRPEEVEPWPPTEADPQPQPLPARRDEGPLHPRPAVQTPGWAWNDRTGRWERMTPEEAAAEEARLARGPTPREAAEGERPTPAQDDPNRPPVSTSAGVAPEAGETRKERRDKRGRMEPQSSISLNSIKYGRMHEILQEGEGAVRSQWFGAAADVTSLDSLGVLDSATGWMVDERAAEVMRGIHHKLAPANYALFNQLRKGELPEGLKGLSGKDLDYALVEREQALVQQHLDAELAKLPEAERAEVTAELSRLINLEGVERLVADQIGDGGVRNAVAQSFPKGGFDFSNQAHREALGKAMIDLRYRVLP